jgi:mono/diheme cytochrome c family protein
MLGAALAMFLGGFSCAPQPPSPSPARAPASAPTLAQSVAEGRRLAEKYCASCHAIDRAGDSRHATAPAFHTLSERYPVTALEEAFAEGVMVGHPAMPEFNFGEEELDALLDYVQSLQSRASG